jgi:hypothetical protein
MEPLKPDCACAQQRKTLESLASGSGGTLSPVRFDGETCANCGDFQRFSEECSGVSLRSRLRGGEGGIRTSGTGLNDARGDVRVSYRDSIFYPEAEGRMCCGFVPNQCDYSPIERRMAGDFEDSCPSSAPINYQRAPNFPQADLSVPISRVNPIVFAKVLLFWRTS